MWSFKQYGVFFVLFFFLNGGVIGTNQDRVPRGQGMVPGCHPVRMHVCGWAGPGAWWSWAGLEGLCSADNCHAPYCTRPQSLPGPYAFQGISPSPARAHLTPAWANLLQGSPKRTGSRKGVGPTSRGPLPA